MNQGFEGKTKGREMPGLFLCLFYLGLKSFKCSFYLLSPADKISDRAKQFFFHMTKFFPTDAVVNSSSENYRDFSAFHRHKSGAYPLCLVPK